MIFELDFCLFRTGFLQATQAIKIKFEIDKKSSAFLYSFIQASHEDIHVEVFVKDKLLLTAEGKEDYFQKFGFILQSFIERKVNGFHTCIPSLVIWVVEFPREGNKIRYILAKNSNEIILFFELT